jgi:predicted RNA binding protein YcfA (HicA-like mRNA interferase family)
VLLALHRAWQSIVAGWQVTFNELVRLVEANGFRVVREKGSVRYYGKPEWLRLVRIDYHGSREIPKGTLHAILTAGVDRP